jgi:hypothetical protein
VQNSNHSCESRDILYYAYHIATADYGRAFMVLDRARGVMARDEYVALREFIDAARVRSEQARTALDDHVAVHG